MERVRILPALVLALSIPAVTAGTARAQTSGEAVEQGVFPKSIAVPGTGVSFSVGGFVKVDFIQDLDPIGNIYEFKVNSIPVAGSAAASQDGGTTIHARESRVNLEVRSDTTKGAFHVFVEGDFFGENGTFRLRHAYGEVHGLLGGQTWTTFMDISARPLTLDFEGPDAEVFLRQALIRWTRPLSDHWKAALAVENPAPEFAIAGGMTGSARSTMPDVAGFVRCEKPSRHAQLAGVVRQIRYAGGPGESDESETGWGVNATFKSKTVGADEIMGQFAYGEGTAHFIEALSGQSLDAVFVTGTDLKLLPARAAVLGYTHHWSKKVRTGLAYGTALVSTDPAQPLSALKQTQDARANVIWSRSRLFDIGAEMLWGRRDDRDGSHGEAWRLQLALTYRLN